MIVKIANTQVEYFSLMQVRASVFIKEQYVDPTLEIDDSDLSAIHFILYKDNHIVATCRLISKQEHQLGRFAVLKNYRNMGIGSYLLNYVEAYAKLHKIKHLSLGAQISAKSFYEKNNYKTYGNTYEEANIMHIGMEKTL